MAGDVDTEHLTPLDNIYAITQLICL